MSTTTSGAKVGTLPPITGPSPSPAQAALGQHSYNLPKEPLVVIQATRSWEGLSPKNLWSYRELLYFLALRDLKVRYKQTLLGMLWVLLQPLLMTIIFTIFLGQLVRVPSDSVPYPLFAYAALMLWTFFSGALLNTGNSLVGNSHLITKVYFPRLIIPVASILARLVDLIVGFLILIGLMIYFQVPLTARVALAPALIALLALLALALGLWTSAVNVKYRDVGLALPVLIQLWMFVSPIVYPLSLVPASWRFLYSLNPLVGIIEGFRAILFGKPMNWTALASSALITFVLLVYAGYAFRNRERTFADIV
jgi:lipopolysaccharide transport system permease protein